MERKLQANVLFIFADQFRAESLPKTGDMNVVAPNLERLAGEGVTLTHTYSVNPVCSPARASMITGLYPHTHGLITNNLMLRTDLVSIAQVYRDHGYKTGYIGKWHIDGEGKPGFVPPGPRRQGFDYWAAFNRGHDYWDSQYFRDTDEAIAVQGYEPDYQTDLAIDFMKENGNKPFCLFMSWGPPHTPFYPPKRHTDENWTHLKPQNIQMRPNVPAEIMDEAREEAAGYHAHIFALDKNLGKIMDALEQQGIADNTLLVFTADHGEMLGSLGLYRKGYPYEESIHIPFLLKYPRKLGKGIKNGVMFNIVDFMPTLLSLSDLPVPEGIQGKDVSAAIIRNEPELGPDSVYIEGKLDRKGTFRAIRTPRYMLSIDALTLNTTDMYDMEEDTYQMNNLAGNPAFSEVEQQLRDRLLQWANETKDEAILKLTNR